MTASRAASLVDGVLHGGDTPPVSGWSDDTRTIKPGFAFVAFGSGFTHAASAVEAGAAFMVAGEPHETLPTVVVPDVAAAALVLAGEAARTVRVVAITGSTGKTLTKDMTAAALNGSGVRTYAARGSRNNEVGLPMTLLEAPADTQVVVAEMGARGVGQIAHLASFVRPDVAIITGIGNTHLGEFGSVEAIARTKSELAGATKPAGLVLCPSTDRWLSTITDATSARIATVGRGGRFRYHCEGLDPEGHPFGVLRSDTFEVAIKSPLPGRPLLKNASFAVAAAAELGADPESAAAGVAGAPTSPLRMVRRQIGSIELFDDSYNASPASVAMALRTVAELADGRPKVAVLGVMAELGDISDDEHRRVAELARSLGFEIIAVGDAHGYGLEPVGLEQVPTMIRPGSVVLAKGSRVAGLDRLTELMPT